MISRSLTPRYHWYRGAWLRGIIESQSQTPRSHCYRGVRKFFFIYLTPRYQWYRGVKRYPDSAVSMIPRSQVKVSMKCFSTEVYEKTELIFLQGCAPRSFTFWTHHSASALQLRLLFCCSGSSALLLRLLPATPASALLLRFLLCCSGFCSAAPASALLLRLLLCCSSFCSAACFCTAALASAFLLRLLHCCSCFCTAA